MRLKNMDDFSDSYNETFESGDPCTECITRPNCKRIKGEAGNNFCDLPEQYEFWRSNKEINEYEKDAMGGDRQSIEELANLTRELLKFKKETFDVCREFEKKLEEE